MKLKINREWLFVLLWSVMIVVIANIPYIYGYAISPPDKVFMGDARSFIDTNTYLAWMHQAEDGHFFFKNIYTTEPHSRMLFNPLFLLLGNLSRFTGMSLITAHSFARVVFGFLLLLMCYVFISYFISDERKRILSFALVSISGGLGWLKSFPAINSIPEAWFLTGWVEGNTFMSIYALPLFSASVLMLLAVFLLMLRSFDTGKLSYSVYAGLIAFLLVSTHYYDALIIYPVIFLYLLARNFLLEENKLKEYFISFGIMLAISALSPVYSLWASVANPVFKEWAWDAAVTLTPGFIWFLGLFGLLALFSVLGAALIFLKNNDVKFDRKIFLAVWLLAVPFMIYMPLPFQRRLIEGAHIPAAILTALAVFYFIDKFKLNARITCIVLLVLVMPGNLTLLSNDMSYLNKNSSSRSVAGFLDRDIYDAMKWLERNSGREDIVLADYEVGNYIPAISGNVVYIGHSPETIDFWGKWELVRYFFNDNSGDEFRQKFLRSTGIKYIFYSWKEKKLGGFNPQISSYLSPVYRNGSLRIYRVRI